MVLGNVEPRLRRTVLGLAESAAHLAALYHRAELWGHEHLPAGPALLVGNHGLYGYETPVFFLLLRRATGKYPVGLAERGFFKIPLVRTVLPWLGGVEGTRDNAVRALGRGSLVVCYPGGAREVFKHPSDRYRLQWEKSTGFVRVAAHAGVDVLPFAGFGVDDTFHVSADERLWVRLGSEDKYTVKLGMGMGPLPKPARFRFLLGAPMRPPPVGSGEREVVAFRDQVAWAVRRLLKEACDG